MPLPKGRMRFYQRDSDGQLEFTGENVIDHTPKDETVRIFTGCAFDLPGGPHTLSVAARDADLQAEAVPAVAKFEINIDPDRQLADLIARLYDPDYDKRKAAVDALARQPDRAAPALQKARETADDDKRWWIDAALEKDQDNERGWISQPGIRFADRRGLTGLIPLTRYTTTAGNRLAQASS